MTKFVILFFTIFLIFNNVIVSSTPIIKRHGPFLSINTGATCEIVIQRDDGLSILQSNIDLCGNSVGINCPLGPGDSQINMSFPMPLNGPTTATTANQTATTIHKYSMAFSIKNADQSYLSCVLGFVDMA